MDLKQRIATQYRRYKAWQHDTARHISARENHTHHSCPCCGQGYEGNYCPRCGQRAGTKRITWSTVKQGVMELWGMSNRSLPYTLWQLIWRPGFLIRDYLSGHRQVSFPPVKMLFIVGLASYLLTSWLTTAPADATNHRKDAYEVYDRIIDWFSFHYDWGALVAFSFFIIPVYFYFRFAPRYTGHTLPEGFYIQVFMGTLFLMVQLAVDLIPASGSSYWLEIIALITIFLLILGRAYKQLFGYGIWGTMWRVMATLVTALLFFLVFIRLFIASTAFTVHDWATMKQQLTSWLVTLPVTLVVVWVCYAIGKRTAATRKR